MEWKKQMEIKRILEVSKPGRTQRVSTRAKETKLPKILTKIQISKFFGNLVDEINTIFDNTAIFNAIITQLFQRRTLSVSLPHLFVE